MVTSGMKGALTGKNNPLTDNRQFMQHHPISPLFIMLLGIMMCLPLHLQAATSSGHKPQWVSKGESSLNARRTNDTYYFKIIGSMGSDVQQLREGNAKRLAEYIGTRNQISGLSVTNISNTQVGHDVTGTQQFNMEFRNEFSSDVFYASLVDEYWELVSSPYGLQEYHYYALYAVSSNGHVKPVFDRFEVTRSYGAAPTVMSIIPGVGQFYKGQKLKGGLMLGGAAIGAGAIVLCENRRSYYQTRIIEQPKFAREWNQKSENWATGRNVAIGVTGALVVWSIIDAAVVPGATRIRISPSTHFACRPAVLSTPDGAGFGASLAVTF